MSDNSTVSNNMYESSIYMYYFVYLVNLKSQPLHELFSSTPQREKKLLLWICELYTNS